MNASTNSQHHKWTPFSISSNTMQTFILLDVRPHFTLKLCVSIFMTSKRPCCSLDYNQTLVPISYKKTAVNKRLIISCHWKYNAFRWVQCINEIYIFMETIAKGKQSQEKILSIWDCLNFVVKPIFLINFHPSMRK